MRRFYLFLTIFILLLSVPALGQTVYEAEDMPTKTTGKAVTDGWGLMGNGHIATDHNFGATKANIKVIARGDVAEDVWPLMEVKVDGAVKATLPINSATWKIFEFDIDVTGANQNISFGFINDFYQNPIDRNLYLDKITISDIYGLAWVTLAWDANTEPDLAGYRIYYGFSSKSYSHTIDVGNITEYTLTGLDEGKTFYLAATAYDEERNESDFSKELIHTTVYRQPGQTKGLGYKDIKRWIKWSSLTIQELLSHNE